MYELERVSLCNWNTIAAQDIEIKGLTGLIGPTGSGKSSVVDAIQTAISGASSRYVDLNASSDGKSDRSIIEYVLGYVDEMGEEPLRNACQTTVSLSFRDRVTGTPLSIGVMLEGQKEEKSLKIRARFIVKGLSFRIMNFTEVEKDGDEFVLSHDDMLERMRNNSSCQLILEKNVKSFVSTYLQAMRPKSAEPNTEQFLRNFRNMVAFKPVNDATDFVRCYMLPENHINVAYVQASIRHWNDLREELERIEKQLFEITTVQRNFEKWAHNTVRLNSMVFQTAYCEALRLKQEVEHETHLQNQYLKDIEKEEKSEKKHEEAIRQLQEEILNIRRILVETDKAGQRELYDTRMKQGQRDINSFKQQLQTRLTITANLAHLKKLKDYLPISTKSALEAASTLNSLLKQEFGSLRHKEHELYKLETEARKLIESSKSLNMQYEANVTDLRDFTIEKEGLEAQNAAASSGGAVINRNVQNYLNLLTRAGIQADVLPDLVEITEPEWAFALESFLGPNREAIFVDSHHEHKAFEILFQHRRDLRGCRLARSSRLSSNSTKATSGALSEIAKPSGKRADIVRKFLDTQAGNIIRVEHEVDLENFTSAIMKNGKMARGVSKRVFDDRLRPILGKTAQAGAAAHIRDRIDKLDIEIEKLTKRNHNFRTAQNYFQRILDDTTPTIEELFVNISNAELEIQSAQKSMENLESPETKRLNSELEELQSDIEGYQLEIDEDIKPRLVDLSKKLQKCESKLEQNNEKIEDSKKNETEARQNEKRFQQILNLLSDPFTIEKVEKKIGIQIMGKTDFMGDLADLRNRAIEEKSTLQLERSNLTNKSARAYNNFLNEWNLDDQLGETADHSSMFAWTYTRRDKLEKNELRPYQEKVVIAQKEMEAAFKEDLLTKMAYHHKMLKQELEKLNRRLTKHRFTGLRYFFKHEIDPSMSQMVKLAERIAENPDASYATQEEENSLLYSQAMDQLKATLERDEDTDRIKDYRQYFTYDLIMETEEGTRTNLSRRARKGSGGQAQAPFYVAIAASMASTYYPNSHDNNDPDGMGLALFDEAFDKLDIVNTQALLRFFGDLNLQVIVAAPEEKRAGFLEVLDTIVSINKLKSDDSMQIDSEHIGQRAKEELRAANPEWKGLEGFQKDLISQEAAD